jgi:hypothetical protein
MKRIFAFVLALILSNAPAFAAVTVDAVSSSACTGCSGDSWSHTTTGANTFMLCGGGYQDFIGGTTVGFTYNSLALTHVNSGSINTFVAPMYRRIAPTTGANTVAVTYSQIVNSALGCVTFAGVDQATPNGTSAIDDSTTGSLSAAITIPANGFGASFAVWNPGGVACSDSTTTQTEQIEICDGLFNVEGLASTHGSSGAISMDWTLPTTDYAAMVAVPINEVAAAPSSAMKRRISVQ